MPGSGGRPPRRGSDGQAVEVDTGLMGTLRREGPLNARPRPRPGLSPGAREAAHARCGARPPLAPVRLRPGHSGRLVVGSGPAAPHRSLLSAQIADSSPPGFSVGEGCTPSSPSLNDKATRLRVLSASVAQSGFEPGSWRAASQCRAANRARSPIAAASRPLEASPCRVTPSPSL